ncbi:MAG: hypothetical protein ACUVSM_13475, partial [Armatimonadota bacterium]
ARPLSREEYQQLLMVRPPFFRYGLRPVSHRQAEVRLRGPGSVTLGAPPDVALMARLYSGDTEVAGTPVFVRRSSNAEVLINPPAAGAYRLRIFAKSCDSSGPYEWAAEYSIKAEAGGSRMPTPAPMRPTTDAACASMVPCGGVFQQVSR